MTDVVRRVALVVFCVVIAAALVGWLVLGKHPSDVTGLLGFVVAAMGVGELSNVGKRATTIPELIGASNEDADTQ